MGSIPLDESALYGTPEYLKIALKDAHGHYAKLNPLSRAAHEESCKYMPGGNTRTILYTTPFPLTIESGQGTKLKTVDGHEYIDFLGEYTAGIYGHNHPVIREAVEKALDRGWNYGGQSRVEQEHARVLCERFPAIDKIRFVNSGTEANTVAIATAIAFTGKKKILIFKKGYHGCTITSGAVPGKATLNLPHELVLAPYNDTEGTKAVLEALPSDSLAAILVEPMLGSGGCFPGTQEFLSSLRELATAYKAFLIFDEVMTSRLSYHGCGDKFGIRPDMMTLGKYIGGGMTCGAFGGREEIMNIFDPRSGKLDHPGTFNNNVFSMTAGIAGCKLLTPKVIDDLNNLGEVFRAKIQEVFTESQITGPIPIAPLLEEIHENPPPAIFVTGMGSLMNIHLAGPNKDLLQALFYHHMLAEGIHLAQRGFIALCIEVTEQQVEDFITALRKFCDKWQDYLKSG